MPRSAAARFSLSPAVGLATNVGSLELADVTTAAQYDTARRELAADSDRSIWLRVAIDRLEERPPLDALEDAFSLYQLARARCRALGI